MKTKTPRRDSHARMMLGLAKTALARALATEDGYLIEQARYEVEHWQKKVAAETLPLTGRGK